MSANGVPPETQILFKKTVQQLSVGTERQVLMDQLQAQNLSVQDAQQLIDIGIVCSNVVLDRRDRLPLKYPIDEIADNYSMSEAQVEELIELAEKVLEEEEKKETREFQDSLHKTLAGESGQPQGQQLMKAYRFVEQAGRTNQPFSATVDTLVSDYELPYEFAEEFVAQAAYIRTLMRCIDFGLNPRQMINQDELEKRPPYVTELVRCLLQKNSD